MRTNPLLRLGEDAKQEKENFEISQEQVVEDAHLTIMKKTKKFVSPLDVHVHHEVPRIHTSTLLAVPVLVIPEASPVYTNIPQSSQTFTSLPLQSTPSPLPTSETTNTPPSILDFASLFRFNDRVSALEKDVAKLKNDPLCTQVTAITEQVRNQLAHILPKEVSNFASPVIKKMIHESLNQVNLAKASSQPQSTYVAAMTLIKFELKKIMINKMNSSESYLTAPEHQECYDGLVKSYNLDKDFFSSYDVKSIHEEEPEFKVRDTDTPQGQEGNQGNDNVEPRTESTSRLTQVLVMRKHGYGYLEEIVVRRADNKLYKFKEDLQLGVESYQKQINVNKPDTTRPDLIKRHLYTPYKNPQGFIYVDDYQRNRLMRSDKLYKFSDDTLTRLLSALEDITKNIDMKYLPKRRWNTLEKKRAHCMIKDINKLFMKRRMMRSLEKFVGGRLYRTDLRLLQRTI
uniref:Uncharacterized protein n=1 Tax=Tanacetum cinerariifolium TaxID=118510 RepID=A0A699HN22_TANCI|nr:hypothetical protein [Tanacetum cinerariifolium]